MAACSPDLDLFRCGGSFRPESWSFETDPLCSRTIRPASGHRLARAILTGPEAVEFLPWLKAALPVESVVRLETEFQRRVGDGEIGSEHALVSLAESFVDEVRSMRLRVRGDMPFDRMSGAVDRVLLGLQEEERLRAAMGALLSGVVVSCECPAYPNRWRKRLRRSGQKSVHPSLFEAASIGGGEGPLLGMPHCDHDPPVLTNSAIGDSDLRGSSRGGWGLFNGPACVWVWPPIDDVPGVETPVRAVEYSSERAGPKELVSCRFETVARRSGGLGNERSVIIGGVGSREPALDEAIRAKRLGRGLLRLAAEPQALASPSRPWEDGIGIVSGGARGIDSAFIGGGGAEKDSGSPRWVILPQGLSVATNGFQDRNERNGIEGCSEFAQGESTGIRWISAFGWRAGFSGTAAMLRNRLIYAFADETIVFSCRLGVGGTWGGAVAALREGRVVRVASAPEFFARLDSPSGSEGCQKSTAGTSESAFRALIRLGAVPLRFEQDFSKVEWRASAPSSHPAHPKAGSKKPVKTEFSGVLVPSRQVS